MPRVSNAAPARPDAKFLTVAQAATMAATSTGTIYRLVERGVLTSVGGKDGAGKKRIPRASFEAWLKATTKRGDF